VVTSPVVVRESTDTVFDPARLPKNTILIYTCIKNQL
jgi:hypothetical protein